VHRSVEYPEDVHAAEKKEGDARDARRVFKIINLYYLRNAEQWSKNRHTEEKPIKDSISLLWVRIRRVLFEMDSFSLVHMIEAFCHKNKFLYSVFK